MGQIQERFPRLTTSVNSVSFVVNSGPMPDDNEKERLKKRSALVSAISLGTNLAVGMAVFAAGGWWIDQKRGGGNAFTLLGIFMGLFYGGYEVWKTVRALEK